MNISKWKMLIYNGYADSLHFGKAKMTEMVKGSMVKSGKAQRVMGVMKIFLYDVICGTCMPVYSYSIT